jgi:23S rRNA pseudouridine2605 synthase
MIRLNKFLAGAGIASRRTCDGYITAGRVRVNGKLVQKLGSKIDETVDKVTFDDQPVQAKVDFIYTILNKPTGIITTASDEYNRQTVLDLLPIEDRIFPVGRLDQDTTGLVFLTNDGDLANQLIHPKYKIPKTYHALLNKKIHPKDMYHFERGLLLDEKMTTTCKLTEMRVIDNCSFVEVIIFEGRNRQIRRMFELLGYEVEALERVAFGPLKLGGLKRGAWRYLTQEEINKLKRFQKNLSAYPDE